jgi:predicted anti-sigma-YlaC factor YlaD
MNRAPKYQDDACSAYAVRLESALESAANDRPALDADLEAHLASCAGCRVAFEDAAVARQLLEASLAPVAPSFGFSTRVLANIRAEEARQAQGSIFWRPLEHLAAKVALVAATIVLLLSFYVYGFMPRNPTGTVATDQNLTLVPQPENQQPNTPDDVLMYLAENGHAR